MGHVFPQFITWSPASAEMGGARAREVAVASRRAGERERARKRAPVSEWNGMRCERALRSYGAYAGEVGMEGEMVWIGDEV